MKNVESLVICITAHDVYGNMSLYIFVIDKFARNKICILFPS